MKIYSNDLEGAQERIKNFVENYYPAHMNKYAHKLTNTFIAKIAGTTEGAVRHFLSGHSVTYELAENLLILFDLEHTIHFPTKAKVDRIKENLNGDFEAWDLGISIKDILNKNIEEIKKKKKD